ncbi:MAG: hypothetical protein JSS02_15610 [Planctomycetes bacterium]|nr:hypothetical protein [Planctomycetota bacterium]
MPSRPIVRAFLVCLLALSSAPHRLCAEDATQPSDPMTPYECRRQRTGCFDSTAPYARCGYGKCYAGYYVGGGSVWGGSRGCFAGESRYANEGTFGMDYAPFYSRVALRWSHGKRYQGGEGQFEQNRVNTGFPNFFRR